VEEIILFIRTNLENVFAIDANYGKHIENVRCEVMSQRACFVEQNTAILRGEQDTAILPSMCRMTQSFSKKVGLQSHLIRERALERERSRESAGTIGKLKERSKRRGKRCVCEREGVEGKRGRQHVTSIHEVVIQQNHRRRLMESMVQRICMPWSSTLPSFWWEEKSFMQLESLGSKKMLYSYFKKNHITRMKRDTGFVSAPSSLQHIQTCICIYSVS